MEIQKYLQQMEELQSLVLILLDNSEFDESDYKNLIQFITKHEIQTKKDNLQHFLQILSNIYSKHHRDVGFSSKIEKILLDLQNNIKQTLSNSSLYNIFQSNKGILLFLLNQNILTLDESIFNSIIETREENGVKFCHFFIPEIKKFAEERGIKIDESELFDLEPDDLVNYEDKRKTGENESYVCALIRQDLVEEFVSFVTRSNFNLKSQIKKSIYETHSFLNSVNPTLIEYAAFFGSIQIFQYLMMNNAEYDESLWLYAIYSNNAELIHVIEGMKIIQSYEKCFVESIKCHHNEIANYIFNNYMNENQPISSYYQLCFEYHNFSFFTEKFNENQLFCFFCSSNYLAIVKLLLLDRKDEIESATTILLFIIFK